VSDAKIGRYEILGELGRGGMGVVYRAIHPDSGRLVALKRLLTDQIAGERQQEFQSRFKNEAYTVQKLQHPNIVDVLDIQVEGEDCFYVMEFLHGESLRKYIKTRGGKITAGEMYSVLRQVGEALTFAHSMNVVHRDVKPDNVFILHDGQVKLTDFGIARAAEYEDKDLTKTGIMMGTLSYVSPEQLQDAKSVDHRADIFSLGVVAYEALSGLSPFTADGIAATIVRIISQQETPLHLVDPKIDEGISSAVGRAMRKKARDRFRSVMDFVKDFRESIRPDQRQVILEPLLSEDLPKSKSGDFAPQKTSFALQDGDSFSGNLMQTTVDGEKDRFIRGEFAKTEAASKDLEMEITTPSENYIRPLTSSRMESRLLTHLGNITEQANGRRLEEPAVIALRNERIAVACAQSRKISVYAYDGQHSHPANTIRLLFDVQHQPAKNNAAESESRTKYGRLTRPGGMAFDEKGRLFVCDAADPYIRVFDGQGQFLREFRNVQAKDAGHAGLAIDSSGLLYLSDSANACIQVFQPETGVWLRSLGQRSPQTGQLIQIPAGLGIDRKNSVYLADYGASRVYAFGKGGQMIKQFGQKGSEDGQLNVPRSVAVDDWDQVFVCDSFNNRLSIFDTAGGFIQSFGIRGTQAEQFSNPSDIAIDTKHYLVFVCDRGNRRVQIFSLRKGRND
jgi:serine/threonine protein kinase/DNA-binding beta-propeller fold protein YncE